MPSAPRSPAPRSPAPRSPAVPGPPPGPDPSFAAGAPTRRALVGGAGAALAAAGGTAAEAVAAPRRRPRRGAGPLPAADRHLVTRFSYGLTPELARDVRRAGGAEEWFAQQLRPGSVPDPGVPDPVDWWPGLGRSAKDLWRRQQQGIEGVWEVTAQYSRACLLRRIHSRRQVHEVMTEFWENLLHVPADGDAHGLFRASYGEVVRHHALGRFDEMLQATTVHPAMLVYLDGAVSTRRAPNENLGRELLELHTVGRGAYSEADVKDSARILTGWSVDMWGTWAPSYRRDDHATGRVEAVGFRHANRSRDGRDVTMAYLRHLAHHPATARRIARRLAVKFVGDRPSAGLVARLARVYREHDTQIAPVLRALVASKEFRRSAGAKVRDPGEDLVATYRALGVRLRKPPRGERGERFGAMQMLWQAGSLGTTPYGWPRPDGQPLDNESWSSPGRILASMQLHYDLAGGWWPTAGTHYRSPRQWLPDTPVRFDDLVDHLAQQVLGRHASRRLVKACSQAVDVRPGARITPTHDLVRWSFPRLLVTLLDSPDHLTR